MTVSPMLIRPLRTKGVGVGRPFFGVAETMQDTWTVHHEKVSFASVSSLAGDWRLEP